MVEVLDIFCSHPSLLQSNLALKPSFYTQQLRIINKNSTYPRPTQKYVSIHDIILDVGSQKGRQVLVLAGQHCARLLENFRGEDYMDVFLC